MTARTGTAIIAAAAALLAGVIFHRYVQDPSFWLDEAFVAVNLKKLPLSALLGPLHFGHQYFPRIPLFLIGLVKEVLGYQTWVLRLLPVTGALLATFLWARIIARRVRGEPLAVILGAGLLLGSTFWMNYGPQFKQYGMDVAFALLPFSLRDAFYRDRLALGRRKWDLALLCLPILLSYTYPIALGGRILGWYAGSARTESPRLRARSVAVLAAAGGACLALLWQIDLRHNLATDLTAYWADCIIGLRFSSSGLVGGARLLLNFIWGWQAHLPRPVTLGVALFQAIGLVTVLRPWIRRLTPDPVWGSMTLGSVATLSLVLLASLLVHYPICTGRLTLFVQIHLQLIALEGALALARAPKAAWSGAWLVALANLGFSAREAARVAVSEPEQNLKILARKLDPAVSNTVYVPSCSVPSVEAMPEALPLPWAILGEPDQVPRGRPVYLLWGYASEACVRELGRLEKTAASWTVVDEGPGRKLVRAVLAP